jgi:hypothetical protein
MGSSTTRVENIFAPSGARRAAVSSRRQEHDEWGCPDAARFNSQLPRRRAARRACERRGALRD